MPDVKRGRRERSDATRSKIVRAAEAEFLAKGFHGATVASVAQRAGVAPQTVYFVFHNKVALISAVIDTAVLGEGPPTTPQDSAWWSAAAAEPDPAEALRTLIRGAAPIFARASAIVEVLRAAARADEELRATLEDHEVLRYEGFRQMIEMVAAKGRLKPGLDADGATDLFWTLYGESTYLQLTAGRGWAHDRVVEWFCEALPLILLDSTPTTRAGRRGTSGRGGT